MAKHELPRHDHCTYHSAILDCLLKMDAGALCSQTHQMNFLIRGLALSLVLAPASILALTVPMETLPGTGVWFSPPPTQKGTIDTPLRVTVWFDKQLLGDGEGYQRRAQEFANSGRQSLRLETIKALKSQNQTSLEEAQESLLILQKLELLKDVDPHWIVNGFSGTMLYKDVFKLSQIPNVRKVFLRPLPKLQKTKPLEIAEPPQLPPLTEPNFENIPWYIQKLKADQVWKDFKITGEGTLNVIHDRNFIFFEPLTRSVYRNPDEIPNNGIDDDGNGYTDDYHGYNFDQQSAQLTTALFTGDPKDKRTLHGTCCANTVSGSGSSEGDAQFGVAPMSQWTGVINTRGIERSVEWAIEQGADTYSMSFSRRGYGEYRSHWRKVMEHGNFCGLYFVSGAGNIARNAPNPLLMNIPQSIPEAVFAAAGVQQDLSKTKFSCVGPVKWNNEHYHDGTVQKPEVCAFNAAVPGTISRWQCSSRVTEWQLPRRSHVLWCHLFNAFCRSRSSSLGPQGNHHRHRYRRRTGWGRLRNRTRTHQLLRSGQRSAPQKSSSHFSSRGLSRVISFLLHAGFSCPFHFYQSRPNSSHLYASLFSRLCHHRPH